MSNDEQFKDQLSATQKLSQQVFRSIIEGDVKLSNSQVVGSVDKKLAFSQLLPSQTSPAKPVNETNFKTLAKEIGSEI